MGSFHDIWRKAALLLVLPMLAGQRLVALVDRTPDPSLWTHDDASMLAQVSQAMLADEPYDETAQRAPGLMTAGLLQEEPLVDQKVIEAQLNAVVAEQRELEALCSYAQ
jgi:hypothetical protein